jgi:bacillithiol system protein YtxJ
MGFVDRLKNINAKGIISQWETLTDINQLETILEESKKQPVAIFKHSTTCGISHYIKSNLENDWDFAPEDIKLYYLDLLAFRPISNEVANQLRVVHQSPQFILLKNGEVVNNWSHHSISSATIKKELDK